MKNNNDLIRHKSETDKYTTKQKQNKNNKKTKNTHTKQQT